MNTSNTAMDMDPELAKRLFAEGAVLIIARVPIGTEFGIDLCTYTVGENFRGVKMISPGPHLVYCSSRGRYGDSAPRVGFIHYFKVNEIVVREWDEFNEELRERQTTEPELEKVRIRENLLELDCYLAPYDYRYAGKWKHLTDTISEVTIERCRPLNGLIRISIELQSCSDAERPRCTRKQMKIAKAIATEDDLLPNLKPIEGTAPRFTKLPDRVPKDAKPEDISKNYIDCYQAIDLLINNFHKPEELIEEIQLGFIFFLIGHSIESLAHWRKVLKLLANSETAITQFKLLYMKYSEVLAYQLPLLPDELMEPTEKNTIYKDIRNLLFNLSCKGLSFSAQRLSNKLEKSMKWKFDSLLDEDPEDMPVIVETQ